MAETPVAPSTQTDACKQLVAPKSESKNPSQFSNFLNVFKRPHIPVYDPDDTHGLYIWLRHHAESVKIILQMFIGTILGIVLLIDGGEFLHSVFANSSKVSFAGFNPLPIVAYGLFFSTGIDLAYMLFTPGPDEAIEPVMTGLAAAILLGIGTIGDISKLDMQHAEILALAIAALAGLFATKKFLFDEKKKNKKKKKDSQATPENEVKA